MSRHFDAGARLVSSSIRWRIAVLLRLARWLVLSAGGSAPATGAHGNRTAELIAGLRQLPWPAPGNYLVTKFLLASRSPSSTAKSSHRIRLLSCYNSGFSTSGHNPL